jgi:hypothetical protein
MICHPYILPSSSSHLLPSPVVVAPYWVVGLPWLQPPHLTSCCATHLQDRVLNQEGLDKVYVHGLVWIATHMSNYARLVTNPTWIPW